MDVRGLFDLKGKVAIVTGASRGLGRGYALNLSAAGANTVLLARNQEKLANVVSEIQANEGNAEARVVDITDFKAVRDCVDEIYGKYGRIDILVNNAGAEIPKYFIDVTEEDYDTIMNTNLKAMYFISQFVAKNMMKQKSGKIINAGSLSSHIGIAGATVYSASKGGVLQFSKALALELAPYNIQVNAIGPGYYHTDMTDPFFKDKAHHQKIMSRIPLGRIGTDNDLAATLIFLASAGSDYITGQIIYVDGGWLAG